MNKIQIVALHTRSLIKCATYFVDALINEQIEELRTGSVLKTNDGEKGDKVLYVLFNILRLS